MNESVQKGWSETVQVLFLWVPTALVCAEVWNDGGWLFYLSLVGFVGSSFLLMRMLWRRELDVHVVAAVIGFALGFAMLALILTLYGNRSGNPLPYLAGLFGVYVGIRYLAQPLNQFYNQRPIEGKL